MTVEVSPADGEKCPRCWNLRDLGTDAAHPEVCARCAGVLKALELAVRRSRPASSDVLAGVTLEMENPVPGVARRARA